MVISKWLRPHRVHEYRLENLISPKRNTVYTRSVTCRLCCTQGVRDRSARIVSRMRAIPVVACASVSRLARMRANGVGNKFFNLPV